MCDVGVFPRFCRWCSVSKRRVVSDSLVTCQHAAYKNCVQINEELSKYEVKAIY